MYLAVLNNILTHPMRHGGTFFLTFASACALAMSPDGRRKVVFQRTPINKDSGARRKSYQDPVWWA